MNIVREITNFFQRLFRQRVNATRSRVTQKARSAQVRAQSKAAGSINRKVDQTAQAAKQKATERKKTGAEDGQAT